VVAAVVVVDMVLTEQVVQAEVGREQPAAQPTQVVVEVEETLQQE
jgi:hypothetical protein